MLSRPSARLHHLQRLELLVRANDYDDDDYDDVYLCKVDKI